MTSSRAAETADTASLAGAIAALLAATTRPLSARAIASKLPAVYRPEVPGILLNPNHVWHRWPGRPLRFWNHEPTAWIRKSILDAAAREPLPRPELVTAARTALPHCPVSRIQREIAALTGNGRLQKKRFGLRTYYYAAPLETSSFMKRFLDARQRETVEWIRQALGLPNAVLAAEFTPARVEELVLMAIRQLEAEPGVPVTARKLRRHRALADLKKDRLDQALLSLRAEGKVILHGETTSLYVVHESERDDLIADSRGKFFVEVARNGD